MLIHRDAVNAGKFNPDLIQLCDFEYWVRIGINTGILYVPDTLAYFRVHGNSTTSSNEKSCTYAKNVIDPFRLKCEYAYGLHFQPLRLADLAKDRNIRLIFRTQLLNEQISSYYSSHTANSPTPHLFEEWQKISSRYSCMKLPRFLPSFVGIWLKRLERKFFIYYFNIALALNQDYLNSSIFLIEANSTYE